MRTYRDERIEAYIDENYPNAKIVNCRDADSGLVFYDEDGLRQADAHWFPLCCYRDEKTGKLLYGGRDKVLHTYTEGETGAGKTTRFVMQSIRALSATEGKPSFVIVDIHGEIIENLYAHLKKMGYDIRILNCDDPARSDTYNPFDGMAAACLQAREIGTDVLNNIRRISEIIQPVQSQNDPIWDMGARSYTNGCILDKFEDLLAGDIPASCITLYNIIENHHWLRREMGECSGGTGDLRRVAHYKVKRQDSLSMQKMIAVTNNAERTRANYFGVIENHFDAFGQPAMYQLSSDSTIRIRDFIERPTAIVIQSGNTRIGDDLISILMNDIYSAVVRMGKASPTKSLPRRIHCFLDEFANCNIADGPEYIRMLTTSRKFGMFWHMILQCDAQLERKFDADIGRIIRANCTEIFMGSQDHETEVRFARSCGQKTVESIGSRMANQAPTLQVVDLITPEKLDLTEEGWIYVKTNRHPLLRTFVEAAYNCPEFERVADIDAIYPHNTFDYRTTRFYPTDIPQYVTAEENAVLQCMADGIVPIRQVQKESGVAGADMVLRGLKAKDLVEVDADGCVYTTLTPVQLELLRTRAALKLKKKSWLLLSRQRKTNASVIAEAIIRHFFSRNVQIDPERLAGLTMVPQKVKDLLLACTKAGSALEVRYPTDFPAASGFRFDVMEAFIGGNDFEMKPDWCRAFLAEFERLQETGYLPDECLIEFERGGKEICADDFTIDNIREIQKMLREKPKKTDIGTDDTDDAGDTDPD